jgi:universal stress protein E
MKFNNIFVVYDPTRADQPALERAGNIAREIGSSLHVFVAIYKKLDTVADRPAEQKRLLAAQRERLNTAVVGIRGRGVQVITEVEWNRDWYSAVVRAAARSGADTVFKSSYRHSSRERFLNRTSDWTLIRECACPVLLVKEGSRRDVNRVLAAIDIRAANESYQKLNRNIIDFSRLMAESRGADVHFINAFEDPRSCPDRNALIKRCGVGGDRIHIQLGQPGEVIVRGALELGASLVVVGNSARSGLSAVINGNTVERVLDKLDCDVLSMP